MATMREYPRTLRINTQLQGELAMLIRGELSDPRVAGVTVTKVDVSPDLRNARVSISLLGDDALLKDALKGRSEEHTSELQSLMRISYAVFCLKKKNTNDTHNRPSTHTSTQN